MVEFWSDHFNIDYEKVGYLKTLDDRDVIRKHALGKFPDLLKASAHSPAMLEYLDNTRSRGRNTNQNYAREIMELHTLGVDGGYTQDDVAELSRILTGWTIQGRGVFAFDPTGHDFTAKTFLATTFPAQATSVGAAAVQEGERAIDMLLAHPSTAKFISKKMIRWLLRYDPSDSLVDRGRAGLHEDQRRHSVDDSRDPDAGEPDGGAAQAETTVPLPRLVAASDARRRCAAWASSSNRQLQLLGQPLFLLGHAGWLPGQHGFLGGDDPVALELRELPDVAVERDGRDHVRRRAARGARAAGGHLGADREDGVRRRHAGSARARRSRRTSRRRR